MQMKIDFDISKNLDELENTDWGDPTYNSFLVRECHRLRKISLQDFTPGNLRIMLGQSISPEYLLPLAINVLQRTPLVEGDYYPGDLLINVLRISWDFWDKHPDMVKELETAIPHALSDLDSVDVTEEIRSYLIEAIEKFENHLSSNPS